jgi:hypothetical protein
MRRRLLESTTEQRHCRSRQPDVGDPPHAWVLLRGSTHVTWALWGCGCACAIIAVVVYPFCNTAYSSAVSYFGSVFSLMAVLATTQVVPKPVVSVGDKTK